jgi:hypothetical protein
VGESTITWHLPSSFSVYQAVGSRPRSPGQLRRKVINVFDKQQAKLHSNQEDSMARTRVKVFMFGLPSSGKSTTVRFRTDAASAQANHDGNGDNDVQTAPLQTE